MVRGSHSPIGMGVCYRVRASLRQFSPNFETIFPSYYILWKEHCIDFTLFKLHSLYYHHYLSVGWYSLKLYDNYRFFDDFFKSNKGWNLSWFIVIGAYDVACP